MAPLSRRRFLGIAGGTLLGASAGSLLPPSLHRAMAEPMRRGGLRAIEHVVILMQENRAFDNYFGTLRGVRGIADPAAIELRGGKSVFHQPNPAGGFVLPFSAREAAQRAHRGSGDI